MSGVRLLVGTRKGAFILTSDAKRKDWKVDGPHFAGWEIYHAKGSPSDPNRTDVAVSGESNALLGQLIVARVSLAEPEAPEQLKSRVRRACRERLAPYKVPARVVIAEETLHSARYKKNRLAGSSG